MHETNPDLGIDVRFHMCDGTDDTRSHLLASSVASLVYSKWSMGAPGGQVFDFMPGALVNTWLRETSGLAPESFVIVLLLDFLVELVFSSLGFP